MPLPPDEPFSVQSLKTFYRLSKAGCPECNKDSRSGPGPQNFRAGTEVDMGSQDPVHLASSSIFTVTLDF